MAADSNAHLRTFMIASAAGIVSLFPLIFTPSGNAHQIQHSFCVVLTFLDRSAESIFKVVYSAGWCAAVFTLLTKRVYEYVFISGDAC